jgi:hypothetical protein
VFALALGAPSSSLAIAGVIGGLRGRDGLCGEISGRFLLIKQRTLQYKANACIKKSVV